MTASGSADKALGRYAYKVGQVLVCVAQGDALGNHEVGWLSGCGVGLGRRGAGCRGGHSALGASGLPALEALEVPKQQGPAGVLRFGIDKQGSGLGPPSAS